MVALKLLGVGGFKDRKLKAALKEVQAKLAYPFQLIEVKEVDEIIQYDVVKTPALLIEDQSVIEGEVPTVDDLTDLLEEKLSNQLSMNKTHQILLPVDFSETAANAYRYAQAIAEKLNLGIKVVHVHQPTYDPTNPYLTDNVLNLEEEKKERLKQFILDKKLDTGVIDVQDRVASALLIGFPSDEIVRLAKADNVDMIIMGTTGDGGMLEQLFGSVSLAVSKRTSKPVILVPPEASFQGFNNILFGGNYESATPAMIDTMIAFARLFNSGVHFVHVKTDDSQPDQVKDTIFNELFADGNPGISFELATVTNKKAWDGLNEYAAENNIDLITMAVPVRSWLEALLHKSVTKEMILHAQRPIMVLHTS